MKSFSVSLVLKFTFELLRVLLLVYIGVGLMLKSYDGISATGISHYWWCIIGLDIGAILTFIAGVFLLRFWIKYIGPILTDIFWAVCEVWRGFYFSCLVITTCFAFRPLVWLGNIVGIFFLAIITIMSAGVMWITFRQAVLDVDSVYAFVFACTTICMIMGVVGLVGLCRYSVFMAKHELNSWLNMN